MVQKLGPSQKKEKAKKHPKRYIEKICRVFHGESESEQHGLGKQTKSVDILRMIKNEKWTWLVTSSIELKTDGQ